MSGFSVIDYGSAGDADRGQHGTALGWTTQIHYNGSRNAWSAEQAHERREEYFAQCRDKKAAYQRSQKSR